MSFDPTQPVSILSVQQATRTKWVLSALSIVLTTALVIALQSGL
jgi:hypothetical protein